MQQCTPMAEAHLHAQSGQTQNYGVVKTMLRAHLPNCTRTCQGVWSLHGTLILTTLLPAFPRTQQKQYITNVYCDNQGVIGCSNWKTMCPYPQDAISDDYPIYAEISQTTAGLKPIDIWLHHIKGHQDTKTDWPLTLPEKLNIECDAHASKMDPARDHHNQLIHPITQAAYPHLKINKQIIIRCLQHTLHDASQTPDYYYYLRNKFNWTQEPDELIHWPTFQLALTRFNQMERRFLSKFIHEWLLLQDRYHMRSLSVDQICPSYQGVKETAQQFLACPNLERQQVWKDLHQSIQKNSICNNINSTLHNLFEHGLYLGHQAATAHNPTIDDAVIWQLAHAQQQTGWNHMYYGRYSPQWIELCTAFHPTVNSTHYFAKNLTLTWQAALATWTIRNKHLHPTNAMEMDQTEIQATIQQIFHNVEHDLRLQEALNYTTSEQIMTKPTWQICQWITNCHHHINNHKKAAKIWAKLCNHDIWQYFTRKPRPQASTTDKNLLRPP